MKASDQFKTVIEKYLSETAFTDTAFATHFAKASKNLESCMSYIFSEVKKTGLCAFDNQEIFDMALRYYADDTIGKPAEIQCKVVVNQPAEADLFTPASEPYPIPEQKSIAKQEAKPVSKTLTLFDL